MYYADEVRRPESLEDDLAWRDVEVRPAELEMAKSLVESLSAEFDPGKYDDTYREDAEVVDLMQALLESVERTKRSRARRPKAKKAS
jgi:DNA end-binding protein Ku